MLHRLPLHRPARPVSFHYPCPFHPANEAHTCDLARAEILLRRLVAAHDAGIRPAHRGLTLLTEALFWHRPATATEPLNPAEYARWFTPLGTPRHEPLSVPLLRAELRTHYGLGERMVAMLLTRQSHGLQVSEQAWLEQRRNMPVLRRPLLRTEYAALVDCVEHAFQGQPFGGDRYTNHPHAERAAAVMGSLAVSPKPPFRHPVLREAYARGFQRRHAIRPSPAIAPFELQATA